MKCQLYSLSYVDDFNCLSMYSEKLFNTYFHSQMDFKIFVGKGNTYQFF